MDNPKPEESDLVKDAASARADFAKANEIQADSTKTAPAKFLQTMALWLEGAGDPNKDGESQLSGWSAQYAANFDREDEPQPIDLAPILGLPQGTTKEELFRVAEAEEEDLIKQLIS